MNFHRPTQLWESFQATRYLGLVREACYDHCPIETKSAVMKHQLRPPLPHNAEKFAGIAALALLTFPMLGNAQIVPWNTSVGNVVDFTNSDFSGVYFSGTLNYDPLAGTMTVFVDNTTAMDAINNPPGDVRGKLNGFGFNLPTGLSFVADSGNLDVTQNVGTIDGTFVPTLDFGPSGLMVILDVGTFAGPNENSGSNGLDFPAAATFVFSLAENGGNFGDFSTTSFLNLGAADMNFRVSSIANSLVIGDDEVPLTSDKFAITVVPEPGTYAACFALLSLAVVGFRRWQRTGT